jgi:hypothetical protein
MSKELLKEVCRIKKQASGDGRICITRNIVIFRVNKARRNI